MLNTSLLHDYCLVSVRLDLSLANHRLQDLKAAMILEMIKDMDRWSEDVRRVK